MSGRHKFNDLIAQLPPERRTAIEERTAELLAAMPAPQTQEEAEHQQAHLGGHIKKQGPKVTRASAERWERQQKTRQFNVTRTSTARWERQRKVISRSRTAGYRYRGRPTEGYR